MSTRFAIPEGISEQLRDALTTLQQGINTTGYTPLSFVLNNVSGSGYANSVGGNNTSVMVPFPGSIYAMSVVLSGARTAGTLILEPRINTVVTGFRLPIVATNPLGGFITAPRDTFRFQPGDLLSVYVSFASFTPTTSDLDITLWIHG